MSEPPTAGSNERATRLLGDTAPGWSKWSWSAERLRFLPSAPAAAAAAAAAVTVAATSAASTLATAASATRESIMSCDTPSWAATGVGWTI